MPFAPPNPELTPPPAAPASPDSRLSVMIATPPHPREGFFVVFWRT
jgi:hypothetical protein